MGSHLKQRAGRFPTSGWASSALVGAPAPVPAAAGALLNDPWREDLSKGYWGNLGLRKAVSRVSLSPLCPAVVSKVVTALTTVPTQFQRSS